MPIDAKSGYHSPQILAERLPFDEINFDDPIFRSIEAEYPLHRAWVARASLAASARAAFVVRNRMGAYSGIAVVKFGESASGDVSSTGMKLSTFKVGDDWSARGIGDILLNAVLIEAVENGVEEVFVTVSGSHQDLIRYLELHGFRRSPRLADQDYIYVLNLDDPTSVAGRVNRLAYDVLAGEYLQRAENPAADEAPVHFLASALWKHVRAQTPRVLELGPGPGSAISWFASQGAATVGVEISAEMASICQVRSPGSLIIIGDINDVSFTAETFDAIYMGAFIHLFTPESAKALLVRAQTWLRPGGVIFVNTTVGPNHTVGWERKSDYGTATVRLRTQWQETEFRRTVESSGFEVIDRLQTDEASRGKFWVAFIAQKDSH